MIKVFGIPNCDSVKKARQWLQQANLDYEFHDYKKQGVPQAALEQWLQEVGPDVLINKRGTTWRKLSDEDKSLTETPEGTLKLLEQNSSVIKRPVIKSSNTLIVGFDPAQMEQLK